MRRQAFRLDLIARPSLIFHGFSPCSRTAFFRDKRRCSAVAGASMIANPTPVALRSAIALAGP